MPVYNSEKFLDMSIQSILKQTFQDYELIIINDGSTDQSLEICERYAEIDKRIKIITQENRGVAYARNEGLKRATGEYIAWVDSDDWIDSEFIQNLYDASCENGNIPVINVRDKDYVKKNKCICGEKLIIDFIDGYLPSAMWSTLFKADTYDNINFSNYGIGEDAMMIINLLGRVSRVCCICIDGYHYTDNPNSITRKITTDVMLSWIEEVKTQREIIRCKYPYAISKMNYKAMMFATGLLEDKKEAIIEKEATKLFKDSIRDISIFDLSKGQAKRYVIQLVKNWKVIL